MEVINIEDIVRDVVYYALELAFDDSISFEGFNESTIKYIRETYLLNQEDANWFYNPIYWRLFLDRNGKESPLFMIQATKEGEQHKVGRRINGFTDSFVSILAKEISEEHKARYSSRDIFAAYYQVV